MAGDDKARRGLRARLGLTPKQSASRQRLVKKSPKGAAEEPPTTQHSVVEEDYLYRSTAADYNVAPEERYTLRYQGSPPSNDHPRIQRTNLESGLSSPVRHDNETDAKSGHAFHKNLVDKDTGERKDLTEMMHALHYDESLDDVPEEVPEKTPDVDPSRPRGEAILIRPSAEIWDRITDFLEPREAANLALTCKTVWYLLGSKPFDTLRLPSNKQQRTNFLLPMDVNYPNQLFCFPCASFHTRTMRGREVLQPTNVLNPLFECPNMTNSLVPPPRHRITNGRTLPFSFVQLVTRAHRFGQEYGITSESLERRWRDPWSEWSHYAKYHVHKNGHLLMRVVSQCFVEGGLTLAAKRMLLYSRDDYTPYFSVCAHWRDGLLMDTCKCALGHVPYEKQRHHSLGRPKRARSAKASLCGDCAPMRRCPRCPTEYLIDVKMMEDRSAEQYDPERFKQALIVTRWTDLGDGITPSGKEWAAVQGENVEEYDSIKEIGNRAVSGIFESAFGDFYPSQRLLNLNPKDLREGEEGNKWY